MKPPTRRQSEIMPLIAEGYATKEIASMLFVSENTIKRHRMILMKKYKAKNAAHLVALWIKGMIETGGKNSFSGLRIGYREIDPEKVRLLGPITT